MEKVIKISWLFAGIIAYMVPIARAEIHSKVVNYKIAGQPFQGYLSYDDAITGKRPGVLVVHEWWGRNVYSRKRADMLAKTGYTAFALDIYGRGKLAEHPDDARKFMQVTLADMNVLDTRFNLETAVEHGVCGKFEFENQGTARREWPKSLHRAVTQDFRLKFLHKTV